MSPEQDDVIRLRDRVTEFELATTKKLGEIEATVRVNKHESANTQQMVIGLNSRMDRFENQVRSDLKDLSDTLSKEVRAIITEASVNKGAVEKKFSAYAGMGVGFGAAVSLVGGLFALISKALGGH